MCRRRAIAISQLEIKQDILVKGLQWTTAVPPLVLLTSCSVQTDVKTAVLLS